MIRKLHYFETALHGYAMKLTLTYRHKTPK